MGQNRRSAGLAGRAGLLAIAEVLVDARFGCLDLISRRYPAYSITSSASESILSEILCVA
jgi:hypothetical protein